MCVKVRQCSVAEIFAKSNIDQLLDEYGIESAIDGLGKPQAQRAAYLNMESVGCLYALGAFQGDTLVGFLLFVVASLPHYGALVATTESFFVSLPARKSGAALKLLRAAERLAESRGAGGLFVTAPVGSNLEKVLPAVSYRGTNKVFFRGFNNARA